MLYQWFPKWSRQLSFLFNLRNWTLKLTSYCQEYGIIGYSTPFVLWPYCTNNAYFWLNFQFDLELWWWPWPLILKMVMSFNLSTWISICRFITLDFRPSTNIIFSCMIPFFTFLAQFDLWPWPLMMTLTFHSQGHSVIQFSMLEFPYVDASRLISD